jgi:hypothetical protein
MKSIIFSLSLFPAWPRPNPKIITPPFSVFFNFHYSYQPVPNFFSSYPTGPSRYSPFIFIFIFIDILVIMQKKKKLRICHGEFKLFYKLNPKNLLIINIHQQIPEKAQLLPVLQEHADTDNAQPKFKYR